MKIWHVSYPGKRWDTTRKQAYVVGESESEVRERSSRSSAFSFWDTSSGTVTEMEMATKAALKRCIKHPEKPDFAILGDGSILRRNIHTGEIVEDGL